MMTTKKQRESRPIKVGLGFLQHDDGSPRLMTRRGAMKIAEGMAKKSSRRDGIAWVPHVISAPLFEDTYWRISLGYEKSP